MLKIQCTVFQKLLLLQFLPFVLHLLLRGTATHYVDFECETPVMQGEGSAYQLISSVTVPMTLSRVLTCKAVEAGAVL